MEAREAYLCTTQTLDHDTVVDAAHRCGLNSGILVFKKADAEDPDRYQIATEVFEPHALENETIADDWCKKYPECRISTLIAFDYDPYKAVVVVCFEDLDR